MAHNQFSKMSLKISHREIAVLVTVYIRRRGEISFVIQTGKAEFKLLIHVAYRVWLDKFDRS